MTEAEVSLPEGPTDDAAALDVARPPAGLMTRRLGLGGMVVSAALYVFGLIGLHAAHYRLLIAASALFCLSLGATIIGADRMRQG